jgi:hypothetical protein
MTSRRINLFLWTGTVVLVALAAGAVLWALLSPATSAPLPRVTQTAAPTTNPVSMANVPALADMQAILDKPLRHNFTGAAETSAATAAQNSADPPLILVGTIGNSLAMLKTRDGKIELKAVGESVAGMTIVTISASKVEARYNGRLISLDKQRRG